MPNVNEMGYAKILQYKYCRSLQLLTVGPQYTVNTFKMYTFIMIRHNAFVALLCHMASKSCLQQF